MSDATEHSYAVLTQRVVPPWTCQACSPAHAFDRWLEAHPQRERNLSIGPRETVYPKGLARYTWTERFQSKEGHGVVARGVALVCPTDHVTPSDLSGDAKVPA